jgi:hypothetical protein
MSSVQVWGGGDKQTSGQIGKGGSYCKEIKINAADCITKVYSYAGAYTEYLRVSTLQGQTYSLVAWTGRRPSGSPTYTYNFGSSCMTGIWGRQNGNIIQLGYYYSSLYKTKNGNRVVYSATQIRDAIISVYRKAGLYAYRPTNSYIDTKIRNYLGAG